MRSDLGWTSGPLWQGRRDRVIAKLVQRENEAAVTLALVVDEFDDVGRFVFKLGVAYLR